eukprot:SAG31_NODE_3505_length_4187_cov_2.714286_4_plen_68_part_00
MPLSVLYPGPVMLTKLMFIIIVICGYYNHSCKSAPNELPDSLHSLLRHLRANWKLALLAEAAGLSVL